MTAKQAITSQKKEEKWIPIFHWQAGKHSQPIVTEIIIFFVLKNDLYLQNTFKHFINDK